MTLLQRPPERLFVLVALDYDERDEFLSLGGNALVERMAVQSSSFDYII
jgi:hypothetical protein